MKQPLQVVHDLHDYLYIVIQKCLVTPNMLRNGRPLKHIGLLPREVVGLFFVCAVGRYITREDWTLASDPDGQDGVILCKSGNREGEGFATEQVYIPSHLDGDLTQLVLDSIFKNKAIKGEEYGKSRHLIIFCDKNGSLDHQKIKKELISNNIFLSFWIVAKFSEQEWTYFVVATKTVTDPLRAYEVTILDNFRDWKVKSLGRI